ncbi:CsbD family protein [Paraburkholderia panacisoli]|uniref:CsbD family protein n=1 Tax=Paraburkholderia panacisoli TaxID=2603818 RepID=A0A5B0GXM3_9BURK|nr:CsbD family protein [Paraburkholderia panacisoli]KAA1007678.1 CsbD family protein [Paraburkholderia panacisoli]
METTNGEKTVREAAGDAQQAAEDLLGDTVTQVSAHAKELSDQARQLYADFTNVVREATVERPFAALAIAAGVGFILGALRAANRSRPDDGRDDTR